MMPERDSSEGVWPPARADCGECPHRPDRLAQGRCQPGESCARAQSGRQMANFFRANPDLAKAYADDPFWERRAIAARHLPQQHLLKMVADPDEAVRRVVAYRLPLAQLELMLGDRDREVRRVVAERIDPTALEPLLRDDDWWVRRQAFERAPLQMIRALPEDEDDDVRDIQRQRLADS